MKLHILLAGSLLITGACDGDDDGTGDTGGVDAGIAADADPIRPDAFMPTCNDQVPGTPTLTTEVVVGNIDAPVWAITPPGEDRLFVVSKPGLIYAVENGQKVEPAFLDIQNVVNDGASERGLLGAAFHPDYQTNNRFYVYYTAGNGDVTLAEYTRTGADDGNPASGKVLLTQAHPRSNHNGGWLAFGPDGYLYMGIGDGGSGGDPDEAGQSKTTFAGKMLRLDVDTAGEYKIPPTNPFAVPSMGEKPEIWAYGLRNPWRSGFDRVTGDLYIADVGQNLWEEVNVQPAASAGGVNYGWDDMEGTHCYEEPPGQPNGTPCLMDGRTLPVYEYAHVNVGGNVIASVAGGAVYRGCRMPDLQGTYFFGDSVLQFVRSFKWDGGTGVTGVTDYPQFTGQNAIAVYAIAEDLNGEILILDGGDARVLRLIPAP